ncbi:MAG: hypothetical protein PGN13_07205 [Patulibacter minatonensis]
MSVEDRSRATSDAPDRPLWRRHGGEFLFNLIGFGLVTELLTAWWEPDREFTLWAVPIRGAIFALAMLGIALWKERRERREPSNGTDPPS